MFLEADDAALKMAKALCFLGVAVPAPAGQLSKQTKAARNQKQCGLMCVEDSKQKCSVLILAPGGRAGCHRV